MKTITEVQVNSVTEALYDAHKLIKQLRDLDPERYKVEIEIRNCHAAIKIMEGL